MTGETVQMKVLNKEQEKETKQVSKETRARKVKFDLSKEQKTMKNTTRAVMIERKIIEFNLKFRGRYNSDRKMDADESKQQKKIRQK